MNNLNNKNMNFLTTKRIANTLLTTVALAFASAASAQETGPIGYVMKVTAPAVVVTNGKEVPAIVGTPIATGSTLRVGPNGAMGVTMKDNTVMSLGPNSELTMDEYQFAPTHNELKLTARITHGTLNFISGVIAKLKPEAVNVKTPTGTIGVRGTHFFVKVDE